jgi:hypothetical protein
MWVILGPSEYSIFWSKLGLLDHINTSYMVKKLKVSFRTQVSGTSWFGWLNETSLFTKKRVLEIQNIFLVVQILVSELGDFKNWPVS